MEEKIKTNWIQFENQKKKPSLFSIFDQVTPRTKKNSTQDEKTTDKKEDKSSAADKKEEKPSTERKEEKSTTVPLTDKKSIGDGIELLANFTDQELLRGKVAIALYDYFAKDSTELSFCRGEIILNVTDQAGNQTVNPESGIQLVNHWFKGELNGKSGLFPLNYVEVTFKESVKVIAEYDFSPESDDEIPLRIGEELVLISMSGDGWYRGKNEMGDDGLFPQNYVRFKDLSLG